MGTAGSLVGGFFGPAGSAAGGAAGGAVGAEANQGSLNVQAGEGAQALTADQSMDRRGERLDQEASAPQILQESLAALENQPEDVRAEFGPGLQEALKRSNEQRQRNQQIGRQV